MGFNLKRRVPTLNLCCSTKLTEKRIKETRNASNTASIVTVVDADLSQDVLPVYDAFPLEAQLASGVPLSQINPTILVDKPQNVEKLVDSLIKDNSASISTENNNQ